MTGPSRCRRKAPAAGQALKAPAAGQALVEFALVIPLFFMLLFGLIDVGRLVYQNSVVSQAAREGARLAAVEAGWIGSSDATCGSVGGPTCPANAAALGADVVAAVNRMVAPFGPVPGTDVFYSCDATTPPSGSWTVQSCASNSPGSLVSVRVVLTFTPITPVIGQLIGSVTTAGAATMVIN